MKVALLFVSFAMLPVFSDAGESSDLLEALTFHASFDIELKADYAEGDPTFFTFGGKEKKAGLHAEADHLIHAKGKGRFGGCLEFRSPKAPRVFFPAKGNLGFQKKNWEGTVSFWLRTSPDEDLAPGYTDPIQITPKSALDACLFFEFGIEDPRPCRVGVFGDKSSWNPEGKPNKEIALTDRPLITVKDHPFSGDRWTHVVFTWQGFNNGDEAGVVKLYLDGKLSGELTGWPQQYSWDLDGTQINLGVKYVGGLDEVSCFKRALSNEEVVRLHGLEKGMASILP